jgi:hypothetical protein
MAGGPIYRQSIRGGQPDPARVPLRLTFSAGEPREVHIIVREAKDDGSGGSRRYDSVSIR